jgi:hypothetical protein
MLIKLTLTDEEAGFLYGQLHRASLENSFRYRRRRSKLTEAQKAAHAIEHSLRTKIRKVLPRGAAKTIEIVNASVL